MSFPSQINFCVDFHLNQHNNPLEDYVIVDGKPLRLSEGVHGKKPNWHSDYLLNSPSKLPYTVFANETKEEFDITSSVT